MFKYGKSLAVIKTIHVDYVVKWLTCIEK